MYFGGGLCSQSTQGKTGLRRKKAFDVNILYVDPVYLVQATRLSRDEGHLRRRVGVIATVYTRLKKAHISK